MKINQNTWHFKLWYFTKLISGYSSWQIEKRMTTLCSYFWTIILSVIFVLPVYYMWRLCSFLLGFNSKIVKNEEEWDYCNIVSTKTEYTYKSKIRSIVSGCVLVGLYIWIALNGPQQITNVMIFIPILLTAGFLMIYSIHWWVEKGVWKTESFRNVIKEFLKARKNKVCPTIEFIK